MSFPNKIYIVLYKVVPRSPKQLKLLSQDLGEMICVTR
jgi:hypothetical protein